MTGHTDSTPAVARRAALALSLAFTLALAGVTAAPATVAAQEQPTVRVESATVTADGTTTVDVVLTSAPNGLAGYYLELSVTGDARIESVSYPDVYGVTTAPEIGADGRTATAEAADLEGSIDSGATDVTLATVTLAGTAPGEATLSVEPVQFDADDGTQFDPATRPGTLTVAASSDGPASTDRPDAATDDGAGTSAAGTGTGTDASGQQTSGLGPLPAVLALVAIAVLAGAGLRRAR
ncbi:MAG: hypothetical protein ABEJ43_09160 [Haloferacaceae archaeon]